MSRFANKTFYKFLVGFLVIISVSFFVIMGTTLLAELDAESATARVGEEECIGLDC